MKRLKKFAPPGSEELLIRPKESTENVAPDSPTIETHIPKQSNIYKKLVKSPRPVNPVPTALGSKDHPSPSNQSNTKFPPPFSLLNADVQNATMDIEQLEKLEKLLDIKSPRIKENPLNEEKNEVEQSHEQSSNDSSLNHVKDEPETQNAEVTEPVVQAIRVDQDSHIDIYVNHHGFNDQEGKNNSANQSQIHREKEMTDENNNRLVIDSNLIKSVENVGVHAANSEATQVISGAPIVAPVTNENIVSDGCITDIGGPYPINNDDASKAEIIGEDSKCCGGCELL